MTAMKSESVYNSEDYDRIAQAIAFMHQHYLSQPDIAADQQTLTELVCLGCLLAVFLPFALAAATLQQLSGISVSDSTLWNWLQIFGQQAKTPLESQLEDFSPEKIVQVEALETTLEVMPLIHCG